MPLERFFAWLDRLLNPLRPEVRGTSSLVPSGDPGPPGLPVRPAGEPLANAALLSVDGAGQFLLCGGERLTLGHVRAGSADLGFLADVGALHATLSRADSLHDGPGWRITPLAGERVTIEGRPVPEQGARIAAGDRVRLGENLEFRLVLPAAESASAVMELLHGAECFGARHIVLLSFGAGGRVRIGSLLTDHVRVPGLDFGIQLEWRGDALTIRSELPLEGPISGASGSLAFPPRERLTLSNGKPRGSRPPFGFALEPVERPGGRS